MYVSKSKSKNGTYYITACKGIRDPLTKKSKKITLKGFGTHELNSQGYKNAVLNAQTHVDNLNKIDEQAKGYKDFAEFVEDISNNTINVHTKNIGYIPYLKIFNALKLPRFFSELSKETKIEYPFSDMIFYQIIQRLFNPGSKASITTKAAKNKYFHDFSFVNQDNIYSALDMFSGLSKHKLADLNENIKILSSMNSLISNDCDSDGLIANNIVNVETLIKQYDEAFDKNENLLFKHLNKHIDKIIPNRDISLAFYDCTTYYFESFTEDELRQRGMSKDNKRNETQVVMGLLIDSNGIPISYKLFKGNQHELYTMEQVIDGVLLNYTIKEIIIVADRGLNSKKNLEMIRSKGLSYIVGSKGNQVPKDLIKNKFDTSWNITSKSTSIYKSGYITHSRTVKTEKGSHEELIIKKYSELYKERDLHKQLVSIERAKKNLKIKTIKSATKTVNKYYKAVENANTKISMEIDQELIDKEVENYGYFYIVTNKLDMDPLAIMSAYKGLYKIEESFRVLKTNLEARPVFHFKERRIRAHFLVCYIALVLQRLLEYQIAQQQIKMSTHEIINGLKDYNLTELKVENIDLYLVTNELIESKVNKYLFKLKSKVLNTTSIKTLIKRM